MDKENSIHEGNKLIAEFMGLGDHFRQGWNPAYHCSWDCLKPVINEIFMYALAYPDIVQPIREMSIIADIKLVWEKVIKAIELINLEKKINNDKERQDEYSHSSFYGKRRDG